MESRRLLLLLLVPSLALTACGLLGGRGAVPPDLRGDWQLVEGSHRGQPLPLVGEARVTLQLTETDVGGTAACNHYGGSYEYGGGRFVAGALAVTEMACEEPLMALEAAYLAALGDVDRIGLDGDTLALRGPGVELQFERVPPVPEEALVGTRWVLDTLLEGEAASSAGGEATLVLADDGTMSGSTGCRSFAGRWVSDGGQVLLTSFALDGTCPQQLVHQDTLVVEVLGDGFQATVEDDRLTVTSGDAGLIYRANP